MWPPATCVVGYEACATAAYADGPSTAACADTDDIAAFRGVQQGDVLDAPASALAAAARGVVLLLVCAAAEQCSVVVVSLVVATRYVAVGAAPIASLQCFNVVLALL
jgi:hypothetical protein